MKRLTLAAVIVLALVPAIIAGQAPPEKIRTDLAGFGPIEAYDSEGKRIGTP